LIVIQGKVAYRFGGGFKFGQLGKGQLYEVYKMVTEVTNNYSRMNRGKSCVSRYVVNERMCIRLKTSGFEDGLEKAVTVKRLGIEFDEMIRGGIMQV
jgi:hypothetical protein